MRLKGKEERLVVQIKCYNGLELKLLYLVNYFLFVRMINKSIFKCEA